MRLQGFHRIETLLYRDGDAAAAIPYAQDLVRLWAELREALAAPANFNFCDWWSGVVGARNRGGREKDQQRGGDVLGQQHSYLLQQLCRRPPRRRALPPHARRRRRQRDNDRAGGAGRARRCGRERRTVCEQRCAAPCLKAAKQSSRCYCIALCTRVLLDAMLLLHVSVRGGSGTLRALRLRCISDFDTGLLRTQAATRCTRPWASRSARSSSEAAYELASSLTAVRDALAQAGGIDCEAGEGEVGEGEGDACEVAQPVPALQAARPSRCVL